MNQQQLNQIRDDFTLSLTKEYVKQGRSFTSILESSEKYGKQQAYWKLSGEDITTKDLEDGKLKGSGTLKKIGKYKHTFQLARNNERTENTTLNVAYFADKKYKHLVASKNIELIAKSYDPDDDPNEPWKLTSTRIDSIKENVAVRAQISNGKPGKKVFFPTHRKWPRQKRPRSFIRKNERKSQNERKRICCHSVHDQGGP